MTIRLHVFPPSPRAFKVLFAAHHIGVPYERVLVNLGKGEQRAAAFTALNPNQRMPVLEDDGFVLWESNAIIQYLAALRPETGLLPADLKARMTAVKWQFWDSAHWDPACAIFMFENVVKSLFRLGEASPSEIARGAEMMARLGPVLDAALSGSRYLAGDAMTVADLTLAGSFMRAEEAQYPIASYPAIGRWLDEMRALPAWSQALALATPTG